MGVRGFNLNSTLGLSKDRVSQACRGIIKTSGGYHWEYINNANLNRREFQS